MNDLSWTATKEANPTPAQRSERVLNLIHGKNMWPAMALHYLTLEFENAAASETQRLSYQLENDRTKVAEGVTAVIKAIKSRDWLTEGRGSYEWDDDKWHTEFAAAAQEILAAIEPLRKIAADWTGCPKNPQEIAAARLEPASEARIRLEATLEAREKAFDWFGDHAPQHCVTRDKELCGWCRGTVEIEAELAQLATTEREGEK